MSKSDHSKGFAKPLLLAAKIVVSAACFWYVLHQIDVGEIARILPTLDFRWAALAISIALLQMPLVALRWLAIFDGLVMRPEQLTLGAVVAITAICTFFTQVLPNLVGEGIRIWLLTRFGCDWRHGLTSVLIDRGVGVGVLVAIAFAILLLVSDQSDLAGYRDLVLIVFGLALLGGIVTLVLMPRIGPLLLQRRYLRWVGRFAADAHRVLLGPRAPMIIGLACVIHAATILIIWLLARAQGMSLPIFDVAVLFTIMVGVGLIPISVGGWGLRELAVVSFLGAHGVAPERALLFSVCFGLVFVIASLPGAVVWLLYPVPRGTATEVPGRA